MKHNLFSRLCALCLSLVLALSLAVPAFAEDSGSAAATNFSVSLPTTLTLTLGTPGTLTAQVTAEPEGAALPSDLSYSWSVTGKDSATVPFKYTTSGSTMTLDPSEVGMATVKVTVSGTINGTKYTRAADCVVEIGAAAATGVTLLPSGGVVLDVNQTQTLTAHLTPTGTTNPANVNWLSSVSGVVNLSASAGQSVVLTGVKPGKTTITAYSGSESVAATCDVTVRGIALSAETVSITVGKTHQLTANAYEVDNAYQQWSSGNESVAIVNSTTGEVTALAVGTSLITVTMGSYSASCYVEVSENTAASITTELEANQSLSLSELRAKLNSVCQEMLGSSLNYITNLSANTDEGVLYYGYTSSSNTGSGVGVSEKYYYSANAALGERALADVVFIPQTDFTGTSTIRYTAFSTTGASFSGEIKLTITSLHDVAYATSVNTPVQLITADFSEICRIQTGGSLSYVTFRLPSSSRGTLYYKYSETALYCEPVSAETKYRIAGIPLLSDVTFVPADGYSGTVTIEYTAVNSAGKSYQGQLTITVIGDDANWDEITYQVNKNGRVSFTASDFNAVCRAAGGSTLSYVRFLIPDESIGTLYYNYGSNGKYASEVSYSNRYYYKDSPSISDISFHASGELTQAVFIDFIAYDTTGSRYSCKLCIEPSNTPAVEDAELRYTVRSDYAVTFDADDFNELSLDLTGSALDYIKFTLPSSRRGVLYYNYHGTNPSKVSESTRYYRSGTLSKVSFVPTSGYTGTFSIEFVGYNINSTSFEGVIWITVEEGEDLSIYQTVISGGAVMLDASDFNNVCRTLTGENLNYVRFTLPSADSGLLCTGYDSVSGTYKKELKSSYNCYRSSSGTSTRRLIEDVVFLTKKTFSGTVEIPYMGWSSSGIKYNGRLVVTVNEPVVQSISYQGGSLPISLNVSDFTATCQAFLGHDLESIRFTTLPDASIGRLYLDYTAPFQSASAVTVEQTYYVGKSPAISAISLVPAADYQGTFTLRYVGTDTSGNTFDGTVSFTISPLYILPSYNDMSGVASAIPSVEFLSHYDVITGSDGQFNPNGYLSRADFVLMVCRAFHLNTGNLTSFSDVSSDSYYAWAVATAKDLGIIQGNGTLFFPQGILTREDAILMLYRAIGVANLNVPTASVFLLSYYTDGDQVSSYAQQAVATLANAGIVTADESGQLAPKMPIRRVEVALMLHRILTF